MTSAPDLDRLDAQALRELAAGLMNQVAQRDATLAQLVNVIDSKDRELHYRQTRIDQLTHEMAVLKRYQFGKRSEQLDSAQASLLNESVDADIAAIEEELAELSAKPAVAIEATQKPKRAPLPANLPRTVIHHEPESTVCGCGCTMKRIGEDVSEKLDYVPGVFSVEQHVRGKWVCGKCETLIQAPVPAHVIDKGIPTAGLLAQVLVAKYADHMPLYRQESIFARAGLALPRSTLGQWVGVCGVRLQPLVDALRADLLRHGVLHADETPVQMLDPGNRKTHRAYLWAYCPTSFESVRGVVYDFAPSRAGEHARAFLQDWSGKLVCDDFSGYKASFGAGVTEIGCMAHARRKFYDLHANNKSLVAEQALGFIGLLYDVEREVAQFTPDDRRRIRQEKALPVADALNAWMMAQRQKVPEGSAIAKALDYSLKRWVALTRYLDDGDVPIDNNWVENQIRPWAIGRSNWLFAGSLRAGQRAAAVMSLVRSAQLNGLDPYAYMKDVLQRLPTQRDSAIGELLPHRWKPMAAN
jgi:transposase